MGRARRHPTYLQYDEDYEGAHVAVRIPPRDRHRHSRAEVREARKRMIARASRHIARWRLSPCVDAETVRFRAARTFAATRTPSGWGNAYGRGWSTGMRYKDRRLRDADADDEVTALRCDGEDPEPPDRDEYGRLMELCNLIEEEN